MDPNPVRIVRHRLVHLDGFLPDHEVQRWIDYAFASERRFIASGTSDKAANYRRSLVMEPDPHMARPFTERVRAVMPAVIGGLRMQPWPVGVIECQLTANNDGSYFGVHTDAGRNETVRRQLTYVWYFNRSPKAFEGGELRIYDDQIRNGKLARTDSFQVVEPRHNSIVFFQAPIMHEVTLVRVASGEFRDSRFTVNGWVQRT